MYKIKCIYIILIIGILAGAVILFNCFFNPFKINNTNYTYLFFPNLFINIGSGKLTLWSVCHFVLFFIIGLICPYNFFFYIIFRNNLGNN